MSLWRGDILHRPAKHIDLVAIVLARERIDDGNRRRNHQARRVADRGSRASGCARDTFTGAHPRVWVWPLMILFGRPFG
jgi:hypothetical protein